MFNCSFVLLMDIRAAACESKFGPLEHTSMKISIATRPAKKKSNESFDRYPDGALAEIVVSKIDD